MIINFTAIYVLWLREMKKFFRAKSRMIATLATPFFFLAFLGLGFSNLSLPGIPDNFNYFDFLAPGIIGMSLLFTSMFAGFSVLWDREFGFLKEIMVAPVSRISIVLGRIAGGATTGLIQGMLVLGISIFLGFTIPNIFGFLLAIVFILLIAITFIGLGLIFASKMRDTQGFGLVINLVVFPIFLLSGALFPVQNLPEIVRLLSFADPLTYGVEGLRASLIGSSILPIQISFTVILGFALLMVFLGAYFFEKSESA